MLQGLGAGESADVLPALLEIFYEHLGNIFGRFLLK